MMLINWWNKEGAVNKEGNINRSFSHNRLLKNDILNPPYCM